jgi:hypothetical protein
MGQNLKDIFEKERLVNHKRRVDHEDLFIERLYEELPIKNRNSLGVLKIAASILVFISLGVATYFLNKEEVISNSEFVLSDISPELKEIEGFYITNINLTLSDIEKNDENQAFVQRYLKRLSTLKEEHRFLITEMNEEGPNSQSIIVLINNLKLQLELLRELKEQLTLLNNNNHETI